MGCQPAAAAAVTRRYLQSGSNEDATDDDLLIQLRLHVAWLCLRDNVLFSVLQVYELDKNSYCYNAEASA